MNRRKFIQWLTGTAAGVAAAHTLDVDKLLWVPGEKSYGLPPILAPGTVDWNDEQQYLLHLEHQRAMVQVSAEDVICYDADWTPLRGRSFSKGVDLTREELAWIGEKMRDPHATRELSAVEALEGRVHKVPITRDRFVELVQGHFEHVPVPEYAQWEADADSHAGAFTEYLNGVEIRKEG
jgi:hypothetical protein